MELHFAHCLATAEPNILCDDTLATLRELRQLLSSTDMNHANLIAPRAHAVADGAVTDEVQPTPLLLLEVLCRYLWSSVDAYVLEAAWIVTNIAGGSSAEATAAIFSTTGMLNALVARLSHSNTDIAMQAIWALGNMAADSVAGRDRVLSLNAAVPMIAVFSRADATEKVKDIVTWTMSNVCCGPAPPPEQLLPMVDFFCGVLDDDVKERRCRKEFATTLSKECLPNILWGIAHATDQSSDAVHRACDRRVLHRVVETLRGSTRDANSSRPSRKEGTMGPAAVTATASAVPLCPLFALDNPQLRKAALRLIRNIVSGPVTRTALALDAGVLPLLEEALRGVGKHPQEVNNDDCDEYEELRDVARVLCNVAAGTANHVCAMLSHAGLVDGVARMLLTWRQERGNAIEEALYVMTRCLSNEDQRIAPLFFHHDDREQHLVSHHPHPFTLLAPTITAIQHFRDTCNRPALWPVVDAWCRRDDSMLLQHEKEADESEIRLMRRIHRAADAWDRAWRYFKEEHCTHHTEVVDAMEACAFFKRFAAFIAMSAEGSEEEGEV